MILKIIAALPAINIKDTIMFYQSKLGFTGVDYGNTAVLKKDGIELHFFMTNNKDLCQQSTCQIEVTDIECLYSDLSALEIVAVKDQLKDKPRGIKEFNVRDNNGNLLRFTESANQ